MLDEAFQQFFLLTEEDKAEYEQIKTEMKEQTEFLWADFSVTTLKYHALSKEHVRIGLGFRKAFEIMNMFYEIDKTTSKSKITKSLADALQYLTSVETNGELAANMMLLLLTADGNYIHLQPDRKHWYVRHATRLKDFETPNLSLGTKIDFLNSCGLTFFGKWIKTGLRNRIAHADFQIDKEGNCFIIEEKDGNEIKKLFDVSKELRTFQMYSNAFNSMLMEHTAQM